MNITKFNFDENFELIKNKINSCDFISIDLELTGIKTKLKEERNDFPEFSYWNKKFGAEKYSIIQLGLSLFKEKKINNQLEIIPINFYLFPDSLDEKYSTDLNLEVRAIEFNSKHNMDFNKWIKEGVPYWNNKNRGLMKEIIFSNLENIKKPKTKKSNSVVIFNVNDKNSLDKEIENIYSDLVKLKKRSYIYRHEKSIYRYYIKSNLEFDFVIDIIENKDENTIEFIRLTEKEVNEKYNNYKYECEKNYQKYLGFNRIWDLLINNNKPLIIHNGYYDLLFLYTHFESNLPENYLEYKKSISKLFPIIYDTKALQNIKLIKELIGNNSICLGKWFENLKNITKIKFDFDKEININFKNYLSNEKYHDASYDSMITGSSYYIIKDFLTKNNTPNILNNFKNNIKIYSNVYFHMNLNKEEDYFYPNFNAYYMIINKKFINKNNYFDIIEEVKTCIKEPIVSINYNYRELNDDSLDTFHLFIHLTIYFRKEDIEKSLYKDRYKKQLDNFLVLNIIKKKLLEYKIDEEIYNIKDYHILNN